MSGTLAWRVNPTIMVSDDGATRLADALAGFGDKTRTLIAEHPTAARLLSGIAEHSPFLWALAQRDPDRLDRILSSDPDEDFAALLSETRATCAPGETDAVVRSALRRARAHVALLVALADIGSVWPLARVTEALTAAADTFVSCATTHLLHNAVRTKRLLADADVDAGCGLVVFGLGKHGAGELNYSSDIDLVVFFDAQRAPIPDQADAGSVFVRVTQALARMLSDRTEDGYVARVDLRLRPDPGATPVALSIPAALSYYETLGQNWERAAFIKARPIAGAIDVGTAFLKELEPFIWRRYFDYAAIADIHAMKRQIHAVRGFAEIVVPGHDVKLGRGGIREIEFFVQTQQLIFGGRRPEMRGRRTLDMLDQLASAGWVTDEARAELTAAYTALRTVEHRLQMVADEQTQRLPSEDDALNRFAQFCGFASREDFSDWITAHFRAVEKHYARLFEHAPGLDSSVGDLVFIGKDNDPGTVETLRTLGYKRPDAVSETIRGWHFGHRPAVRSARAREVLTDLVPALLQSFAQCGDPDGAVAAFDAALARMPAATELFAILRSNAALRILFGDILGAAPRLTDMVTSTPHVLDTVIDPRSFSMRYDDTSFMAEVAAMAALDITEEFLDRCRLLARENQFVIGVRVLSNTIEPRDAGPAYSGLATALVGAAFAHVRRIFAREHGTIEGLAFAIVALGKLGSREMTAASDLDLMVIYRAADDTALSDGPRPLSAPQYAARLTQRLIAALTAPTREGRLYEIDLRLRPWGTQGPLAVRFEAFAGYHATEAETWERMSLCRARPIAGDAVLCEAVTEEIRDILTRPREDVARDIVEMRGTIAQAKGQSDLDDLKTFRGGLLDIEFIAQYLILHHGKAHPSLLQPSTNDVIDAADACGVLAPHRAAHLRAAHRLFTDVVQMQRLALAPGVAVKNAAPTVRRLIATGSGFPDAGALNEAIASHAATVRRTFDDVLRATRD